MPQHLFTATKPQGLSVAAVATYLMTGPPLLELSRSHTSPTSRAPLLLAATSQNRTYKAPRYESFIDIVNAARRKLFLFRVRHTLTSSGERYHSP